MKKQSLSLLLSLLFLFGCASRMNLEDHQKEFMVRPLSELKQEMSRPDSYASKIKWKESTYPLANGNYVFIEPLDKNCFAHWEVNQKDLIVGFQAKGSDCGEPEATGTDVIKNITTPAKYW